MPCQSQYLEPNSRERESVKVMNLMHEVGLIVNKPGVYGRPLDLDIHTADLCNFCQNNDVTRYSLELQIWWRDHQAADRKRIQRDIDAAELNGEKQAAISKLSEREKKLLGLL